MLSRSNPVEGELVIFPQIVHKQSPDDDNLIQAICRSDPCCGAFIWETNTRCDDIVAVIGGIMAKGIRREDFSQSPGDR